MFEEIHQGRQESGSAGRWAHAGGDPSTLGFDFRADGSFDADPASLLGFVLTIFTVPENISAAEVTGLAVEISPLAVVPSVPWQIVISGAGPQEYLVGSNRIVSAGGAPTVPVAVLTDSGLIGVQIGSLNRPAPVRIRLQQSQGFGIRSIGVVGIPSPRCMVLTRATGIFYR